MLWHVHNGILVEEIVGRKLLFSAKKKRMIRLFVKSCRSCCCKSPGRLELNRVLGWRSMLWHVYNGIEEIVGRKLFCSAKKKE